MPDLSLIIVGLFTGLVGGMLGVGGSIVMIPAMTLLLGPDQHLYQAAAMIVNFFVVVPAVWQHHRSNALHGRTVLRLVPLAGVAVVAGVLLSELPVFDNGGEAYLRALFGLFLLGVCAADLYQLVQERNGRKSGATTPATNRDTNGSAPTGADVPLSRAAIVALPTGIIAGLLGVGGGVIAVPLQRRWLHVPIRNAIANSAAIIVATSAIGATLKNIAFALGGEGWRRPASLALILIPTAILGSLIGARLTHVVPVRIVKTAFLVLLGVAALRMVYGSLFSAG